MAANPFIEPINKDFSDGKPENWPKSGLSYRAAADYNVREKLAKLWRDDRHQSTNNGMTAFEC